MVVDIELARKLALKHFTRRPDRFYGVLGKLTLGAGLLYERVKIPVFNEDAGLYDTRRNPVLVLTHECDVSSEHEKHFNDYVLVAPLIPFETWVESYAKELGTTGINGIIPDIAADRVHRVQYIPPVPRHIGSGWLSNGAIIFLNQICSTHAISFSDGHATPKCALTREGLRCVDLKLENHLRRPKTQILPRLD